MSVTFDISLVSTDHGRERRSQRGIEKIDLKTAVKYGKREQSSNGKWKFTFADTVLITDSTCTIEISSWRLPNSPLERANVDLYAIADHEQVKTVLLTDPTKCISHTVVVLDQSGSMRESDVDGYITRSDAVFAGLATDFVTTQLRSQFSSNSEVLSVVTMQNSGTTRLEREPITWVLYNKLLDLKASSTPKFNGNFVPALTEAKRLLRQGMHPDLALHLIFLSDGRPSDFYGTLRHRSLPTELSQLVADIARQFGQQIAMKFIGFGQNASELTVLPEMCRAAERVGVKAEFVHSRLQTKSLSEAMQSSAATVSQSISDIASSKNSTIKGFTNEVAHMGPLALASPLPAYWNRFRQSDLWPWRDSWGDFDENSSQGGGIAVCKHALGSGLERIVYRLRHLSADGTQFVGPPKVAKESKMIEGGYYEGEGFEFHKFFCATQHTASHLAMEFNAAVSKLANFDLACTPRIEFLECSVYTVDSENKLGQNEKQAFLVGKMLDKEKYQKWNDNAGGVDGNVLRRGVELHQKPAAVTIRRPPTLALAPVLEEEEESDDDDNDAGSDVDIDLTRLTIGESSSSSPSPSPVSASEYCGYTVRRQSA